MDFVVIHLLLHPPATIPLPSCGHKIMGESNDNPPGRGICLPTERRGQRGSERPSQLGNARFGCGPRDAAAGLKSLPLPWEWEEGWAGGDTEDTLRGIGTTVWSPNSSPNLGGRREE